ncbi:MAG: hypothetical protein H6708_01505 [Kofleriaceae bacterium]|nr:hypothetical protein [Kofleriaceae bacterium]
MRRALALLSVTGAVALTAAGCGDAATAPDAEPAPWTEGPPLPGGRLEPAVAAVGDALWVVGGLDDGLEVVTDTWILDPGAAAWRPGPATPVALTHANLAAVGDTLYLLGGLVTRDFVPDGRAWALDPGATAWRPLAAMPAGAEVGAAAVIVDGDTVVLAGGSTVDASVATVLAYDTVGDAWSRRPDLPSPRSHAVGARAPDGAALVIGGTVGLDALAPLADVLALAPGASAWTARAAMPTARGGCAADVLAGELWCAGGEAGVAALHVVEVYDLGGDAWRAEAALPVARAGTHGAAIAGALWIPGGAYKLAWEPQATVAVLTPP